MTEPQSIQDYEAHIRQRAEQLWEEAGRPAGQDEHFWFMAEQAFAADHPESGQADIPLPPEHHSEPEHHEHHSA